MRCARRVSPLITGLFSHLSPEFSTVEVIWGIWVSCSGHTIHRMLLVGMIFTRTARVVWLYRTPVLWSRSGGRGRQLLAPGHQAGSGTSGGLLTGATTMSRTGVRRVIGAICEGLRLQVSISLRPMRFMDLASFFGPLERQVHIVVIIIIIDFIRLQEVMRPVWQERHT